MIERESDTEEKKILGIIHCNGSDIQIVLINDTAIDRNSLIFLKSSKCHFNN